MRKITKRAAFEPDSLGVWKRRNPNGVYADLTEVERQDIRTECSKEQFFICAYCCKPISGSNLDTMNEHVESRKIAPNRSLDFSNIVGSCTTRGQCDDSHGSQHLPLTPFMDECETEFEFTLSGKIRGLTDRAKETIKVLNLGDELARNRSLIEQRKQFIQSILLTNGVDPDDGLDDDELIDLVIDDISEPKDGKLDPFSPVAINVLRQWIA
ncbi:TIGR02646 family protein [Vibrio fluvialis]|uniref:TIGR02646 family protein n=1 Tax=Vibrio fluvialis TaxID=676 RepID=UPI001EEAFCDD|nr:TIGR02646 family protein [Vibrio fluvialis]MCG6341261.1 TIGR02646 family protein [Vibrio fluvialis]